jgi:RNA polymerase sigma factor (sigma-70 family)
VKNRHDVSSAAAMPQPSDAEATGRLLERARAGDRAARDAIFERYLPRLNRWASGRLPRWARDVTDTHDLVQDTLLRAFNVIERFEPRSELALQVYLRQAVANRVRDELRRFGRRAGHDPLQESCADLGPSPLEAAIGAEAAERLDRALERLAEGDRELIIARVELGWSFEEIAAALGRTNAAAARKACQRALVKLAQEMGLRR